MDSKTTDANEERGEESWVCFGSPARGFLQNQYLYLGVSRRTLVNVSNEMCIQQARFDEPIERRTPLLAATCRFGWPTSSKMLVSPSSEKEDHSTGSLACSAAANGLR